MTALSVGDRVIVKGFSPDDPDPEHWSRLVGHYGHIKKFVRDLPIVTIKGCVNGPIHEAAAIGFPIAFYPEELEHID